MNIAIYSRKSKFVEGSESIENQIQLCKEYIKHNIKNIDNLFIYEDEGFSGKNVKRPEYQKMMTAAKNKMFNVLVCYKLDRISRNVLDFSDTLETLNKLDISFVSITERFDTNTPMGRAMIYIASVFAQLERETIAERVRDNMIELAKTGKWLGGNVPFGYIKEGIKNNANLKLNKKYRKILIIFFNKYIENRSIANVLRWTIDNNIKTDKGRYFSVGSLKLILTNPVYCIADEGFYNYAKINNMIICNSKEEFKNNLSNGISCYNKRKFLQGKNLNKFRDKKEWIIAIGNHEGIVSSDIWIKTQKLIEEKTGMYPRTGTAKIGLLTGLLRCKKCGGSMGITYSTSNGKTFYYYRCANRKKSTKLCTMKNVKLHKIDNLVLDKLLNLDSKDNILYRLIEDNKKDNSINTIDEEIKVVERQISKNKNDIESLTIKLIEIDKKNVAKIIEDKIDKLDLEINSLKEKLDELNNKKNNSKTKKINIDLIKQNIEILSKNRDLLTTERKKKIIKSIIKTVYWDGKDPEIILLDF